MVESGFAVFVDGVDVAAEFDESADDVNFAGVGAEDGVVESGSAVVIGDVDDFGVSCGHDGEGADAGIFASRTGGIVEGCSSEGVFGVDLTSCFYKYFK